MQAKGQAIHLNLPHDVVINLDRDSFWINQFNSARTEMTPKVVDEEQVSEFVTIDRLQIGSSVFTAGTHAISFEPDGKNPYVLIHLIREFDDPSEDLNYFSVRLYPSSAEPQILPKQRV
jgi:hypothetical protein